MSGVRTRVIAFAILMGGVSVAASAQQLPREPNVDEIRIRLSPLFLNPLLALTNAGIDTNVFNEADQDVPERDFTVTITPATDWWIRLGRSWLIGNIRQDLVWYKDFPGQRSVNGSYTASWLVPRNRLTFSVGGIWLNTKERPGFEIDARAERSEQGGNGVVEIRALSKTFLGIGAERRRIDYDDSALYQGSNLARELNRTVFSTSVRVRNQLTPLTSINLTYGREQDRFELSPLRDSDSNRYDVGVSFDPFALIKGSAQVGYRNFKPSVSDVPSYTGATALVNLSYVALGSTRLGITVNRDVQYSFSVDQPYYLQSGVTGSIGQQIYGPLDVEARIGSQRLAYRDRIGAEVEVSDRIDRVRSYGFGLGYRLGRDLRLAFNAENARRTSELDVREYDGLRYGLAVTFGTQQ